MTDDDNDDNVDVDNNVDIDEEYHRPLLRGRLVNEVSVPPRLLLPTRR